MELVATPGALDHLRRHGGALYVWPLKAKCCGGTIELRASTDRPNRVFRRVDDVTIDPDIELYLTAGMADPDSLHVELGRRGKLRAYWNGLAWVM